MIIGKYHGRNSTYINKHYIIFIVILNEVNRAIEKNAPLSDIILESTFYILHKYVDILSKINTRI